MGDVAETGLPSLHGTELPARPAGPTIASPGPTWRTGTPLCTPFRDPPSAICHLRAAVRRRAPLCAASPISCLARSAISCLRAQRGISHLRRRCGDVSYLLRGRAAPSPISRAARSPVSARSAASPISYLRAQRDLPSPREAQRSAQALMSRNRLTAVRVPNTTRVSVASMTMSAFGTPMMCSVGSSFSLTAGNIRRMVMRRSS